MADQYTTTYTETPKVEEPCETPAPAVESTDRGLFGFGKKDEEKKCEEEVIATEFDEKVKVTEEEPKHESLAQKFHRSDSSSSSSSDEEYVDENGEKKKKKKLKDRLKDKISGGEKKEEEKAEVKYEDTAVPIEKCDDVPEGEKKGFLEKIKDKLPGGKKTEEVAAAPPADCYAAPPPPVSESYAAAPPPVEAEKEKKGFLEKIKEKIPGYHPKTEEEKEKEKEKESC